MIIPAISCILAGSSTHVKRTFFLSRSDGQAQKVEPLIGGYKRFWSGMVESTSFAKFTTSFI